jgi:hypothetical protein
MPAASSTVALDRTAYASSSPKARQAPRTADSTVGGTGGSANQAVACRLRAAESNETDDAICARKVCSSRSCAHEARNSPNAAVVTQNAGGTGRWSPAIRARFTALPPTQSQWSPDTALSSITNGTGPSGVRDLLGGTDTWRSMRGMQPASFVPCLRSSLWTTAQRKRVTVIQVTNDRSTFVRAIALGPRRGTRPERQFCDMAGHSRICPSRSRRSCSCG